MAFQKLTCLDSYTGIAQSRACRNPELKKWKLRRLIRKAERQFTVAQLAVDPSWLAPRKCLVFGIFGNKYSYLEVGSSYDGWPEYLASLGLSCRSGDAEHEHPPG